MLLDALKAADRKVRLLVKRHLPAGEDGAEAVIMTQKFGRAVDLFVIARRLYNKTCRPVSAQRLLQFVKSYGHVSALVANREEERFLEFLLLRKEFLGLVYDEVVIPPETRAGRDAGVEQRGTGDQRVDC